MRDCTVRDLSIKNTAATGLGIDHLHRVVIDNVTVTNCGRLNNGTTDPGGNGIGIGIGGMTGSEESIVINRCHAHDNKRGGIMVEAQGSTSRGVRVVNCYASGNGIGFLDAGGWGATWMGNYAKANIGAGFAVKEGTNGLDSLLGRQGRMDGNFSYFNGGQGFLFDGQIETPAWGYLFANNTAEANPWPAWKST